MVIDVQHIDAHAVSVQQRPINDVEKDCARDTHFKQNPDESHKHACNSRACRAILLAVAAIPPRRAQYAQNPLAKVRVDKEKVGQHRERFVRRHIQHRPLVEQNRCQVKETNRPPDATRSESVSKVNKR